MRGIGFIGSRLAQMSRAELIAGSGVALIVSGLVVRFAGHLLVLPVLAALRALPDEMAAVLVRGFGLLEIAVGISLLAYMGRRRRNPSKQVN